MDQPSPTTFNRSQRWQKGAAALELALMLPWLILMLDGVIELGVLIHNQSVLSSASSLAARAGIAGGPAKLSTQDISLIALTESQAHLMLIAQHSSPSVEVVQSAAPHFQQPLEVTIRYTFQGLFVGGFLSVLQLQPEMQVTTVMYNE